MASLAQNSACRLISSDKNSQNQPVNKKGHSGNLAANFPAGWKPSFRALALEGQKMTTREKWKARCSDDGSCGIVPEFLPFPSAYETVQEFYQAFEDADIHRLEELILPYCVYQDLVFYGPHEGKQDVIEFLQTARDAMGQNIHLVIDEIKGHHLTASVRWHLRWKDNKIPFTNGCRCFKFEKVEGRLLISKITGVEELPVNPSELSLKLLKAIRGLFDRYPFAAEMLLKAYGSEEGKHPDMHFNIFGPKR